MGRAAHAAGAPRLARVDPARPGARRTGLDPADPDGRRAQPALDAAHLREDRDDDGRPRRRPGEGGRGLGGRPRGRPGAADGGRGVPGGLVRVPVVPGARWPCSPAPSSRCPGCERRWGAPDRRGSRTRRVAGAGGGSGGVARPRRGRAGGALRRFGRVAGARRHGARAGPRRWTAMWRSRPRPWSGRARSSMARGRRCDGWTARGASRRSSSRCAGAGSSSPRWPRTVSPGRAPRAP